MATEFNAGQPQVFFQCLRVEPPDRVETFDNEVRIRVHNRQGPM
jgi:hypothetical protein